MKSAIALRTFRRSDTRKIVHMNDRIEGEDQYIDELRRNRMVRQVQALTGAPENKALPPVAASGPSSVSQAAQASHETTLSASESGEKPKRRRRKKAAESS